MELPPSRRLSARKTNNQVLLLLSSAVPLARSEPMSEKLKRRLVHRLAFTSLLFFFLLHRFSPLSPPRAAMNCALKPSPRVTRSSGSAFANGGNSLAAPMRALSVASTSSASRRPLTVEGRRKKNRRDESGTRFCWQENAFFHTSIAGLRQIDCRGLRRGVAEEHGVAWKKRFESLWGRERTTTFFLPPPSCRRRRRRSSESCPACKALRSCFASDSYSRR